MNRDILGTTLALLVIIAAMLAGFFYQFNSDYPFISPLVDSTRKRLKLEEINSYNYSCRLSDAEDSVYFTLKLESNANTAVITGFALRGSDGWLVKKSEVELIPTN